MISRLGIFVFVILLGLFVGARNIETDYDHNCDFSQFHTFAAKIGASWGSPLSEDGIKNAVANALTKRGLTQSDEASADALVVVHGATQTKKSLDTFYSGGFEGYGWRRFGPCTATTTGTEYTVGTLVVDVFVAKEKKLVFRGLGQDEVSDKVEKNEKKIEKGTEKMFKDFPPHPRAAE